MKFTAEQYCTDVLEGKIIACEMVILACKRHRDDLLYGHERGLYFDTTAAKAAVIFFPTFLKHWKAGYAGKTFVLQPWQQFITWVIFGWKRADHTRRYRTAYIEVARKNGKTSWAAGMGLFMMLLDGEEGAEIYTAATKRDQARIAHKDAKEMVKRSPKLRKYIKIFKDNLSSETNSSSYEPLGANHDSLDGLNMHCSIVDEIHAHKSRDLWDVLEESGASRDQPLMLGITTAGSNRQTICFQLHVYTEQILSSRLQDDSFFGIIFTLDEDDDWEDERNWIKANPSIGVNKKWSAMREAAAKAKAMTSALNNFLRKHLNVWTAAATRWLKRKAWDACGRWQFTESDLHGRRCYGGLDLSSTLDVTAWVLVFPPLLPLPEKDENGQRELTIDHCYIILPRLFIPEENMEERIKRDRVPFDAWERAGYIIPTPGNVIDHAWIIAQIDADMQQFDVQEAAFDRWGAAQIQTNLIEMGGEEFLIQFGQGFVSMSPPSKEFERLVMLEILAHGNNPALTWMADNVVIRSDPAENIKPDKEKSFERIDGIVATIMGLDRATRHKPKPPSRYERLSIRGV